MNKLKWIPLKAAIIAALIGTVWYLAAVYPSFRPPEVIPAESRYDIVVSDGECWVVARSANGRVEESVYHGDELDDCVDYLQGIF